MSNGTCAFPLEGAEEVIELKRTGEEAQHLFLNAAVLNFEDTLKEQSEA